MGLEFKLKDRSIHDGNEMTENDNGMGQIDLVRNEIIERDMVVSRI